MNIEPNKAPSTRDVLRKIGDVDDEKEGLITSPLVKPEGIFGARHVLGIMGFLGFANVYAMRVNLSVAVVAMVNNSAISHVNKTSSDACPGTGMNSTNTDSQDGEFAWDENKQALILGCFFWGYIITNPIGGRLGELFGGKIVFGIGVLVTAVLTLLTPIIARTSVPLLIAARVLEGLGEGVTFPAMNALMARWVPPLERSKMSSLVYAGAQFGTVVSLPICGLLCQSTFLGGWPSVFYVFGVLGVLWFVVWTILIHSEPENHPRIRLDEKVYIQRSLQRTGSDKTPPIPIMSVLTSMPFWAIFVVHIAQNWGFYTLLTELPTYMKNILHFNLASSGFMSALPYLAMWLFSLASGQLADYLRSAGILSTTTTRKVFNSIGIYGPMVCIVLVGYAGCNKILTIVLLCIGVGLNGAIYSGYMNSHLDIAPNFAGTLMGLTNCAATVPGFLAPMAVGAMINGRDTVTQWKLVFWIAAIIYFIGNTFYIIFVSGEEQPWNNLPDSSRSSSELEGEARGQSAGQYQTFASPEEGTTSPPAKVPEIF